jgi:hypothetical protein
VWRALERRRQNPILFANARNGLNGFQFSYDLLPGQIAEQGFQGKRKTFFLKGGKATVPVERGVRNQPLFFPGFLAPVFATGASFCRWGQAAAEAA